MNVVTPIYRALRGGEGALALKSLHPLTKLIGESDLLAQLYMVSAHNYHVYLKFRSPVSRKRALEGVELLIAEASHSKELTKEEIDLAVNKLVGMRRKLIRGVEEDENIALSIMARREKTRRSRAAERLARRVREDRAGLILAEIEESWADLPFLPAKTRKALELFLLNVPSTDIATWSEIADKLAGQREMVYKVKQFLRQKGVIDAADIDFRNLLRPQANAIKGYLLERAFWQSAEWRKAYGPMMRKARERARNIFGPGSEVDVVLIAEPLRELHSGAEIYDGAIMLVGPTKKKGVIEGVIHATFQMKAERDVSVLSQIERDMYREQRRLGSFQLRPSSERELSIVVLPAMDRTEPHRIFVAPQLPGAAAAGRIAPGIDAVLMPSLLDAAQLDEVAYKLLADAANTI